MSDEVEIYYLHREVYLYLCGYLDHAGRVDLINAFQKHSISTPDNSPPRDEAGGDEKSTPADSCTGAGSGIEETGF